jgi:hypothetical protein
VHGETGLTQLRQEDVELSVPDEGLASHQVDHQRPLAPDEILDSRDERLAPEVGQASEGPSAHVLGQERVAAGAGEGTGGGDLDGEDGPVASEDAPPGPKRLACFDGALPGRDDRPSSRYRGSLLNSEAETRSGTRRGPTSGGQESEAFYASPHWWDLRDAVIEEQDLVCRGCNVVLGSDDEATVGHVRSRGDRPDLALSTDNLQVLCRTCNPTKRSQESE